MAKVQGRLAVAAGHLLEGAVEVLLVVQTGLLAVVMEAAVLALVLLALAPIDLAALARPAL